VTASKWARNRRQRILQDISFDSDVHNIYDPVFTASENESSPCSNIRPSIWDDCGSLQEDPGYLAEMSPKSIKGAISTSNMFNPLVLADNYDSSSDMSVAEERDTISVAANTGVTPNLSRIMNICSISKIEQHSMMTFDSPNPYLLSKSSLSHSGFKQKKNVYATNGVFRINHYIKDLNMVGEVQSETHPSQEVLAGSTRNSNANMSSFANHFKYQTANSV
jgi:hypothetical protein